MINTQAASVLFVDDEKDILDILSKKFKSSFEHIYVADNADTAIQIVRENEIDVAVLDFKMPDKNGLELCWLAGSQKISGKPQYRGMG